ncbi:hypothetical protein K490DRAFT_48082 [Saccharata proteae CBS 121410]|uniref:Tafazzin n=1 Tax=Saccharata proteae CBS 121410 TaxID=1314787 RepID=A0A9P4HR13_9PEZI|nr:hypothetical protein K490DRAFT_48082 [Saccharata proteae CBS 121410]
MPKKHQQNFKPAGNYIHPSLSSTRAGSSSSTAPTPRSVNDRLNQLRREQTPKASVERRNEIAESLTQRAVHPAVQQILNITPATPLRPRTQVARTANGRRVPGPAAPESWLNASRHAPRDIASSLKDHLVGDGQGRFRPVVAFFPERMPDRRSLIHQALKTLAANWDWLLTYEQHYLATMPVQLKSALLSHLAMYGPEFITMETVRILFLAEKELEGATGSDELLHLDLSGLICRNFSVADLTKYIRQPPMTNAEDLTSRMRRLSTADVLTDSWEDAAALEDEANIPPIPRSITNIRFPHLTHLSLSHPRAASWSQLLNMSSSLATLTHLSLAYWPTPSMTPNATTATLYTSSGRAVNMSGTHYYSALDQDWSEAANILRRFAKNTYCLRWLDLTGCPWAPALTYGVASNCQRQGQQPRQPQHPPTALTRWDRDRDAWAACHVTASPGPDWNGSWRQLSHLVLSQGWVPHNVSAIRNLPAGLLACELLGFLRTEEEAGKRRRRRSSLLPAWMEREERSRDVARAIREVRQVGGGAFCQVDYGWSRRPGEVSSGFGGAGVGDDLEDE